jgi:hypothetical protein
VDVQVWDAFSSVFSMIDDQAEALTAVFDAELVSDFTRS